jgi:hypothetical protein
MDSSSSESDLKEMQQESKKPVDTSIPHQPQPTYVRSLQQKLRGVIEPFVETCFRNLFFWETNDKQIGLLIRSFHSNVLTTILIVYWISHTVIHSYWLLWSLWVVVGLIWLQHILTGCCIPTHIERRLIGDSESVLDPMLKFFNVPTSKDNNWAIFLSTTIFLLQSLELYSRTVLNIQSFLFLFPHLLFR